MKKKKREIDFVATEVHSWWGEAYVYAKEKRVKTYKAFLVITFFSGVVATVIWLVSFSI